jgi:peptidoglycan/LPS O-acetylase OafA/YrhL
VVNIIGRKLFFPDVRIAYVTLAIACTLPVLHALTQRIHIDRTVGELSYGMYLVHVPVIAAYQYYLGSIQAMPVAALSIAAAALLFFVVERPIDRLRQRLVEKKTLAPTMRQTPAAVAGVAQVAE